MYRPKHALQRGAIVSCYFPLQESPDQPGPVARPALVVAVFLDRTDGEWKAAVAYGTSRRTRANMGYEVRINHPDSLTLAGLSKPTRFTLSRMRILPITRDFFNYINTDTPVTGKLDDALTDRLEKTCETLASIAAPLRVLTAPLHDCPSHHSPAETEAKNLRVCAPQPGTDIDLFMRDNLNGRPNLNGYQKCG